jgi:hypothetical protein
MIIYRTSPFTGKRNQMDLPITLAQMCRYMTGNDHIQDVFPLLTPAEREFILSGITPEEWDTHIIFEEEE